MGWSWVHLVSQTLASRSPDLSACCPCYELWGAGVGASPIPGSGPREVWPPPAPSHRPPTNIHTTPPPRATARPSWRAPKSPQVGGSDGHRPPTFTTPDGRGLRPRSAPHAETPLYLGPTPPGPEPEGRSRGRPSPTCPSPTPPSGRQGLRGPSLGQGGGLGFASTVSCLPPPRRG